MPNPRMLSRLGQVARDRGLTSLAERFADLAAWMAPDLGAVDRAIAELPPGPGSVGRAAHHLIGRRGKRLRPMCVALASRLGSGFDEPARRLAVAVELVHAATLLHDDVVDLGPTRRGQPAARAIYGNAASIFAGDWLLVEALRQINQSDVPGLVADMLDVIEQMIVAESLQLERRGNLLGADGAGTTMAERPRGPYKTRSKAENLSGARADYFTIAEGKTAALFRWAMRAGGRAAGLGDAECAALDRYGLHVGVAFQVVDDVLDIDGDAASTGKQLLADLREGKLSLPLVIALERDSDVAVELVACAGAGGPHPAIASAVAAVRATGAIAECRRIAADHAGQAISALAGVRRGEPVQALITVAEAIVHREV